MARTELKRALARRREVSSPEGIVRPLARGGLAGRLVAPGARAGGTRQLNKAGTDSDRPVPGRLFPARLGHALRMAP